MTAMLDQDELRRRMRAARALGGFQNMKDLAAAIPPESQLGERKLRALESGEDALRPPALREIAAACDLPYEFFTADLVAALDASSVLRPDRALGALRLDRALGARLLEMEDALAKVSQRLDAVVADLQERGREEAERALEDMPPDTGTAPRESESKSAAKRNQRGAK